ncbi:MAG: hypothetical protein Q8O62_04890 [Aequorivita sp.]|nr:hypothetical protein [Aequorivita sp.]
MNSISRFFSSINNISTHEFDNNDFRNVYKSASELLIDASKNAKIKDNFKSYYFEPTATIISFIESEKTKSKYNLLYDIYTGEIVFYSSIENWENLKNIDDKFWADLINICQNCEIKFSAGSKPFYDKEITPEFNANFKSIIFNMMSVYVTAMLETKSERENFNFGQLEIIWTTETTCIADIITELNDSFKIFYRLNYLLWKAEDIRRQNRNSRKNKRLIR